MLVVGVVGASTNEELTIRRDRARPSASPALEIRRVSEAVPPQRAAATNLVVPAVPAPPVAVLTSAPPAAPTPAPVSTGEAPVAVATSAPPVAPAAPAGGPVGLFFELFRGPSGAAPGAGAAVVTSAPPASRQLAPVAQEPTARAVVQRLEEAIALTREQRHEQAVPLLEEIIREDPGVTAAWEQLGWSYWALGRKEDAIALWRRLLALDPRNAAAWSWLARAAAAENDLERAIEYNRKSLELAPDNPGTRFDLARVLLWKGSSDEAIPMLESLLSADPNRLDVLMEYAKALTYAWQFERALPLWQRLREVAPDEPSYMGFEALCRLHTNDAEGARELARRVLDVVPDDATALDVMASLAEFGDKPAEAVPHLRRMMATAKTQLEKERYRARLIRLLVRLHKAEPRVYGLREAIDLSRERLAENPTSVDARLLLGELLLMDMMLPDAEREFIAVLRDRNPYNIRARKGLLEVYLAAKQYDAAREQLVALSRFNPQDPYLLYHLARIESARGDFYKAHEALRQLEQLGLQGAVAVLLYHGLLPSRYFTDALSVDRFREHMVALQKARVRFVRCSELPTVLGQRAATNEAIAVRPVLRGPGFARPAGGAVPLMVAVSFDDARRDSMRYGTQVGTELGLVFSMHVPVGYILQNHPFICTWDMLREYAKAGCWEFGGHMLEGAILTPVDASGRLWHALPNLIWRADLGRMETPAEYDQRLAREFRESRAILQRELGGPVNFVAYPFGDIGQEDETNVDDPVGRILTHARRHFQVGFIQSVFGYAVAGDDPLLYQRHEPDRWMSGEDVVDYLYEHHPVFLARRLRAEYCALEGKLYAARDALRSLEEAGYPERPLARVRKYVEERLAGTFRAPAERPGTIKKSPWTLELRKPYVGADAEYFRDNQDRQHWRLYGLAGLNVTPNLQLEGRAGIGHFRQDVTDLLTNAVVRRFGRRRIPTIEVSPIGRRYDVDERTVGGRAMFTFPNGVYLAGELLERMYAGDAHQQVLAGSLESQLRPVPPVDLLLRYEHDVHPSALAIVEDIRYHMLMGVANVRLQDPWSLLLSAIRYDFTDDNVRDHFAASTSWTLHERTGFRVGLRASWDSAEHESRAYWTPYHLQRYAIETGVRGNYLRMYYNVRLRLGIGREDVRPEEEERYRATVARARLLRFDPGPPPEEDWEPVLGLAISFRKPIGEHWVLNGEFSYNRNPNYNEISLLGGVRYKF
ncbi:MAG: tetratricopeptide repeat protein [Kiritimatiellae bacterium]|nr:tetratricopeptide repeat protein [Kiritimatiellia bacterium]